MSRTFAGPVFSRLIFPMRIRSIVPLLAVLISACGDESPTEVVPTEARFRFEYRMGDETTWRTFDARGLQPADSPTPIEGVRVGPDGGQVLVAAQHQRSPGSWASFYTPVPLLERGTSVDLVPMGTPCTGGRQCVVARFDIAGGTPIICSFSQGGYVITGRSEEWVSATLSARGQCTVGDTRTIEVRNGVIDIKLP